MLHGQVFVMEMKHSKRQNSLDKIGDSRCTKDSKILFILQSKTNKIITEKCNNKHIVCKFTIITVHVSYVNVIDTLTGRANCSFLFIYFFFFFFILFSFLLFFLFCTSFKVLTFFS